MYYNFMAQGLSQGPMKYDEEDLREMNILKICIYIREDINRKFLQTLWNRSI